MTISIWITAVISIFTLMAGFWIGRSIKWMTEETEERVRAGEEGLKSVEIETNRKRIPLGFTVFSPVSGLVRSFFESNRCGAIILPEGGEVYAPVSGRIIKLYPMGRAMLIAADCGKEILIKVGNGGDELISSCYRAKVVKNEIITKGKILLEFDKEGLENQGVDVTVTVSLENNMEERNVVVTPSEHVKVGEELMWA